MGCFAKKNIAAGTAFKLDLQVMENDARADQLEDEGAFFVAYSFSAEEDPLSRVIHDGELTTFSKVKECISLDRGF